MDSMHNPGNDDPGGGYQPIEPSYGPPPKKKGFNWLACCGISCGVILVIGVILSIAGVNLFKNFMGNAMTVAIELQETDAATIRSQAQSHSAEEVAQDPAGFTSNWVAMECVVMSPSEYAAKYFNSEDVSESEMGNMSGQQGTMYLVDGGFMVIDTSNAPNKAQPGDTIVAYGKPFVMNFKAIPGMGDKMPPELDNLRMFMAKEVDKVGDAVEEAVTEGDADQQETTGDSEWTE